MIENPNDASIDQILNSVAAIIVEAKDEIAKESWPAAETLAKCWLRIANCARDGAVLRPSMDKIHEALAEAGDYEDGNLELGYTLVQRALVERNKNRDKLKRIGELLEKARELPYSAAINNGVAAILNEP